MILKQSLPFALLTFLMSFYNRIDSVMLERMLPEGVGALQAGIYAHSFRLLDAGNMIPYLFSVLLLPIFSRMTKVGDNVAKLIKLSFTMLTVISVTVVACSFFFNFELMELLYTSHIEESAVIFRVLMIGFIAISSTYVFGTLLTANGSLKELNIIAGSGMVLNLILNLVLIPKYQALGSAYASVITQFLIVVCQIVVVTRKFHLKPDISYLLRLAFYIALVFATGWFASASGYSWYIGFGATALLSVIYAASLKLLHIKGLISIIREKPLIRS
jgi:O-antigen/teichoic acid export membrane protein